MTVETMPALCESVDWQTRSCRAIVPCSGEGMSDEEAFELQCEQKGGIAQPGPGEEFVCVLQDPKQARPDLTRLDPCNHPEAQGTEEMCSSQGPAGPGTPAGGHTGRRRRAGRLGAFVRPEPPRTGP